MASQAQKNNPDESWKNEIYTPEPEPEESWPGWAARGVARSAARIAETAVGLPGDIKNLAESGEQYVKSGISKLAGGYPEAIQNAASKLSAGYIPEFGKRSGVDLPIPTSGDIRKHVTQRLTGQYLEPKTDWERFGDDVVSDFGALAIPGIKGVPFKNMGMHALKKLGISLGGNALAEMTKEVGGGELAQTGVKLGFFVLSGIPGTRKAITENQKVLYKSAEDAMSKTYASYHPELRGTVGAALEEAKSGLGAQVESKKYVQDKIGAVEKMLYDIEDTKVKETSVKESKNLEKTNIRNLEETKNRTQDTKTTKTDKRFKKNRKNIKTLEKTEKDLKRERKQLKESDINESNLSKAEYIKVGTETTKKAKRVRIKDIWEAKKDINELLYSGDVPNRSYHALTEVRDELKKILYRYGERNPEFLKYFEPAENIEHGLHAQSKVGRFIQKNINLKYDLGKANLITKGAFFGLGKYFGMPLGRAAAGLAVVKGGYNLFSLLAKSKPARIAYANVIKSSLKNNRAGALSNIKKFNSEANKYFPEQKWQEEAWTAE